MMSGKLDRRITIKSPTVTQDSHGGAVKTWSDVVTTDAQVIHVAGREPIAGGQYTPEVQIKFRIRYRSNVDETMRVTYDGKDYDIVYIAELGRREGLELLARLP